MTVPHGQESEPHAASGAGSQPLTAEIVRGLFAAASAWLGRNAAAIDAINVFPVPDGDTGTNMAATMRGGLAGLGTELRGAGEVASCLARNALMSARGNSGVILSQILRGFAQAVGSAQQIDGWMLAQALAGGSRAAYNALEHPVEGTILTVVRAAADAAGKVQSSDPRTVLEGSLAGARAALARTPELLPMLKQASVVDSGGYGLVVLLEGAVRFLRGEQPPDQPDDAGFIEHGWLEAQQQAHAESGERFGYCTEFIVRGAALDGTAARARLRGLGDSLLVAGAGQELHVHVHAHDPGAVLSAGIELGALTAIKIENMQFQYDRLRAAPSHDAEARPGGNRVAARGVIGVFTGDGFEEIARSLGITDTVSGGETSNPSVEQILQGIQRSTCPELLLLPNHRNVVLAAEQAAALAGRPAVVVKTRSMPQGIAALLAFVPDDSLALNAQRMAKAAEAVLTIEVTRAARATHLDGREVSEGEPIALIDGALLASGAQSSAALLRAIELVALPPDPTFTLYTGLQAAGDQTESTERLLRAAFPDAGLQIVRGGQPLYDFILAIE